MIDNQHDEISSNGFAALMSAAVDGIIIINSQGKILSFNSAAQKLFGYLPEEVEGKNVNMLMPEPYKKNHDGYLQDYLQTGNAKIIGIGRRVEAKTKAGSVFPVDLSVGEYDADGVKYFVGIIRDLTKREQIEQELQESRERLNEISRQLAHIDRINIMGEMASGIAHEINQPLAAISSYIQACLRRLDEGEPDIEKCGELLKKN